MPETNNTSYLGSLITPLADSNAETMISIDRVSMVFNIASEQLNSLKEYAIALTRRELLFKEFRALDDISLDVKRGDVFGILGTNGSGKSTLLKIIAGVLEPSRGTCTINGNIAPLIELGAGFDLELTARENIYLNGALLGYSKKFIEQHFSEIVEFAEVESFLDMPMKNYSSGMVARIAFAIATVIVPDILIVDEVLSVGDFMFQQKCEQRIRSLIKDHGVTVLIVSHNNDQIERLCNKAAWIEKGHLRAVGSAHEVCQIYQAIGGRPGTPESEQTILRTLQRGMSAPKRLTSCVYGDDRFGAAVQMNRAANTDSKTVIVVNSEAEREGRIAMGLAGALDAPLLTTQPDQLPDTTLQEIRHRKPRTVIIVGNESSVQISAFDTLCASDDAGFRIVRCENTPQPIGLDAFAKALENGGSWGDAAALATDDAETGMVALSPYLFSRKIPVFYRSSPEAAQGDDLPPAIAQALANFSRVIAVGEDARFVEALAVRFPKADIVAFDKQGNSIPSGQTANDWLQEEGYPASEDVGSFVVTSPTNTVDNRIVGAFAGRIPARIIFEDPQNLDSVARTIAYMESLPAPPDSITFLGSEMRFTALGKELIGKAAASAGK